MSSEALQIAILLEKSCLSCIQPTIWAAKFWLSRILQHPARFKRNLLKLFNDIALWGVQLNKCSLIPSVWADKTVIIMMKENNSMLVHFQKQCKIHDWNSLDFSMCKRITWFRWAIEARISQRVSCYLAQKTYPNSLREGLAWHIEQFFLQEPIWTMYFVGTKRKKFAEFQLRVLHNFWKWTSIELFSFIVIMSSNTWNEAALV